MKFRTRMIMAYALISVLLSAVLGLIVYRTGISYDKQSKENSLVISAKSHVVQMEDRFGRMDAIMYYILSDPSMLNSMIMLGRASEGALPASFMREAEAALQNGISTEYIMENSYRTVFFNESGFLASSALKLSGTVSANQRLIEEFELQEIDYLGPVVEADGHSVIVGPHNDFWGAYGEVPVYSLMKAPRGYGLQFLEVENRLDSLDLLESSNPDMGFTILVNGDELLYMDGPGEEKDGESAKEALPGSYFQKIKRGMAPGEVVSDGDYVFALAESDSYDVSVLSYMTMEAVMEGRNRIFLTSFLSALATLAVGLAGIIVLSSILIRPVKMLQKIVEDTNIGNLQNPSGVEEMDKNGGLDEFTNLAHAYQAMTNRLDTALQNEKRSAMLQLQAQFDTLQTQVNPHFIYNVLNIISSRAILADDEVICEMCGSLGNILRYSTNNKARYAKISEELEYLNSYFYLLKSRYENRLQVKVDVDSAIMDVEIPKMTLQQIVENSVKHGFHETNNNMELCILGREDSGGWMISILDNGTGADEEKLEEIREKLAGMKKNFRDYTVSTESEIGGLGLTNTYARCLLLFGNSLIFEFGNREDGNGFEVRIGQKETCVDK